MSAIFADVVEEIKKMDIESKIMLDDLIKHFVVEERRDEILANSEASIKEYNEGKIAFGDVKAARKIRRKM